MKQNGEEGASRGIMGEERVTLWIQYLDPHWYTPVYASKIGLHLWKYYIDEYQVINCFVFFWHHFF